MGMTIQILIAGTGGEVHKDVMFYMHMLRIPSNLALLCAFVKDQNKPAIQFLFYDRYSQSD